MLYKNKNKNQTQNQILNIKKINILIIITLIFVFLVFLCSSIFAESNALKVSLINQNPDPVRSGDILELKFTIENNGNLLIRDVVGELYIEYPFTEIPGQSLQKNIGTINPYQNEDYSKIINYKVLIDKDTPSGSYKLKLKLTNSTNKDYIPVFIFDVDIIAKEYAQIITINKSNISFGKEENLEFIINNTGNSPLQNMVFSWEDPEEVILPVFSDNTKYIKYLDVGENIIINYKVMANVGAVPGLYKLNLNLSLEDEYYQNSEINSIAGIFVGGTTDFAISSSESTLGNIFDISISIANIGNDPAYSVNIIIPNQDNFSVSGSNSSIVGNLDKGDYTIETFSIETKKQNIVQLNYDNNRSQKNNITNNFNNNELLVLVEYTDSIGIRHSLEKKIEMNLSQNLQISNIANTNQFTRKNTNSINISLLIYIIIGCLILFSLYKYYTYNKKKKLEKKLKKKEIVN
jgi:hypothetical protein